MYDISKIVEQSNCCGDVNDLFDLILQQSRNFGADCMAYGSMQKSCMPARASVISNYPVEWVDRYFEENYFNIDPIISKTLVSIGPTLWSSLQEFYEKDSRELNFLNEAGDLGLKKGVSFLTSSCKGTPEIVSFSSNSSDIYAQENMCFLNVLACFFSVKSRSIREGNIKNNEKRLSPREAECLTWAAQGKSSWDIGMILKISENTVNFHIRNAMEKLDTSHRIVAIVKAMRLGIIQQ